MDRQYRILAYYLFTPIEDPAEEVRRHFAFFEGRDVKGRIYISSQGINGQMSAAVRDAEAYREWLMSDPRFSRIDFKIHSFKEHVFPRLTVKMREQLVALDEPVDPNEGGEHLDAPTWRAMLERRDANTLLLDVRNRYEWEIGHFEGAELPPLESFREFPAYAKQLSTLKDPHETKVMVYCTGGIRCELYSALLKREGFEEVYQLSGGVIGYGLSQGSEHWRGKLFVFDDRLAISIAEEEQSEVISRCLHCQNLSDIYYNCANMDCNELFICCPLCAEQFLGCCSASCMQSARLRPYVKGEKPKPFRKKHLIH